MVGGMNVVLIKRDARLIDHEPLTTAASCHQLPLLILYVYDVCQLRCDTYHESHHQFINEGLMELNSKVQSIAGAGGGSLTFRTGCTADVLKDLHSRVPIRSIFSHYEVGNHATARCNELVREWCNDNGVVLRQFRQDGVSDVRHEALDEGSWAKKWTAQMIRPQLDPPEHFRLVSSDVVEPGCIANARDCGVKHLGTRPGAQYGGESKGIAMLESFLQQRGEGELPAHLTESRFDKACAQRPGS